MGAVPPVQPVALTAFYCCALRAADAAAVNPVCGDRFAARFLDDEIKARIQRLLRFHAPGASNVARHRIIDDILRKALKEDPQRRVILLGAGFDTRAFRLGGGQWWEFDDSKLFAFKEQRLPAHTASNPLVRIPIDFSRNRLIDYLTLLAGKDPAIVVLEGVSMYLTADELTEMATTVRQVLPRARLICDLMTPAFRFRFSRGLLREIRRLGANFAPASGHPRLTIEAGGFTPVAFASIVSLAREAGTIRIPRWLLDTLLRELRDGYAVWTFDAIADLRTA